MYSPDPVEGGGHTVHRSAENRAGIERLEERLAELEGLAEALEGVPDEKVVGVLERAVALLAEVNDRLETGLESSEKEARELGELLDRVDFGPLDEALERAQRPPEAPDEAPPSGGPGGG